MRLPSGLTPIPTVPAAGRIGRRLTGLRCRDGGLSLCGNLRRVHGHQAGRGRRLITGTGIVCLERQIEGRILLYGLFEELARRLPFATNEGIQTLAVIEECLEILR
ncbi:MAG: hypothetical protein ABIJ57_15425, partial [Pseudomonadota bacterium]